MQYVLYVLSISGHSKIFISFTAVFVCVGWDKNSCLVVPSLMSLSETFQISSISIPGSQLQCYWVQGIRESHDLMINLARDVSRDGAAAAICNYEHNRLGHCIQIIWNIYKLSWTQPLSVASPVQYQEYEYDKGNIWVLIADVKIVDRRQTIDLFWPGGQKG